MVGAGTLGYVGHLMSDVDVGGLESVVNRSADPHQALPDGFQICLPGRTVGES